MQATVRGFDQPTRTGSVFLGDGTVREFGRAAFDASGLLRLRPGQRVSIRCHGDGTIAALTLVTLPLPGGAGGSRDPSSASGVTYKTSPT